MQGTFLDDVLDAVDAAAKRAAKASVHRVGWIRGLQPPSVCFVREGTQIHHPRSALRRDLTDMHQERYPTERQGASVGYSQYAMVVKASVLTNEDHMQLVGIRHGLQTWPGSGPCPCCRLPDSHDGDIFACPAAWVYAQHHVHDLARVLPILYTPWRRCWPTDRGLLVLYSPRPFLLRVARDASPPTSSPMWGLPEVPVYSMGHTGGRDASTLRLW